MFQVFLAETTAATNQASAGSTILAIVVGIVVFFIALAIIDNVANGARANQPSPDFRPVNPGEGSLPSLHGSSRPSGGAPINIDVEIGSVDIVRGLKTGSGPRRPLN